MKKVIKKLVMGEKSKTEKPVASTIEKRIRNIKAIWNNDHQDDVGIEKIFRLFLAASQFLFPGIYIKQIFGKYGNQVQDLAMDLYVLCKVLFPFLLVYSGNTDYTMLLVLAVWFMLETILYVPTLIFASDVITRPSSYRRSMLLLFFNYFEIISTFALIYTQGDYLNQPFAQWYDSVYFSFTTLGTIGFGDFYPVTGMGKFLVCCQSLIFLAFVVLFINYFSNRVESTGYFDHTHKD